MKIPFLESEEFELQFEALLIEQSTEMFFKDYIQTEITKLVEGLLNDAVAITRNRKYWSPEQIAKEAMAENEDWLKPLIEDQKGGDDE